MKRMKLLAGFIVLALLVGTASAHAQEAETEGSTIVWYMKDCRGYTLPEGVTKQIRNDLAPSALDCGEVRIELKELLYDGQWLYTVASAVPTNPSTTLVFPAGAELDDAVSEDDKRAFKDAAKEDDKQLIRVYTYPREFDEGSDYFLNYRQTDQGSLLISGSVLGGGGGEIIITWQILLYDVDPHTGRHTLIREETCQMPIRPMEPYTEKKYLPVESGDELVCASLVQTPLQTYLLPVWSEEEAGRYLCAALLEADGAYVPESQVPDSDAYALEALPEIMVVSVMDMFNGSEVGTYALVAE